jgi:hypothetical protein
LPLKAPLDRYHKKVKTMKYSPFSEKNRIVARAKILYLLLFLGFFLLFAPSLSSCRRAPAGEQTSEELAKKGKPKPKKCKIESCQVRMTHKHNGVDFKGKRGNFFVRLFTPKESKYGQGLYRNHYNKK